MITVSVSSISRFLQCKRLYQLRRHWEAIDDDDALVIGRAVHAGLAHYHVSRLEEESYLKAFELLPPLDSETMRDTVYACLSVYFHDYLQDPLTVVSTETEVIVPMTDDVSFRLRVDGLVNDEGFRILEAKTTSSYPGNFWPRYELDFQTTGYVWAARKHFELPIKGALVVGIFKPTSRSPKAQVQRRRITPTEETIANWMTDTIAIAKEMEQARAEGVFPKSWQCISGWGRRCEFFTHCSHDDDIEILRAAHRLKEEKKDGEERRSGGA